MLDQIRKLFSPPVFENEEQSRVADLLNTILWGIMAAMLVLFIFTVLFDFTAARTENLYIIVGMGLFALAVLFLSRRGYTNVASIVLVVGGLALNSLAVLAIGSIRDAITSLFGVLIIIASLLIGGRAVILAFLYSAAFTLMMVTLEANNPANFNAATASNQWGAYLVIFGMTAMLLRRTYQGTMEALARARSNENELAASNLKLQSARENLVERIAERTSELERRARYLEAAAAIGQEATSQLNPQVLLDEVVVLIAELFNFYNVSLYLLDDTRNWLTLQAASSYGGRRMMAEGKPLSIDTPGPLGFVVRIGEGRISQSTELTPIIFDYPELPDTRSEISLPLRARGQTIGVLNIQDSRGQTFLEEDISVLQTLSDQVALAIDNAQLYQQAQETAAEARQAMGDVGRQALSQPGLGESSAVYRLSESEDPLPTGAVYSIPINVRGQSYGALDIHKDPSQTEWTEDEIELLKTLTGQLSIALESAQLFQESQRRAVSEQYVSAITANIRETLDIETILKTATQEVRQTLDLPQVYVRLLPKPQTLASENGHTGEDTGS